MSRPRLILGVALAAMASVAVVHTASAARPQYENTSFVETGSIDCGAFTNNFTDYYTIRDTRFFNGAGEMTSEVLHVGHRSDDVNSLTGLTLHEHDHFTIIFDLVAGTYTVNGAEFVMNRRGQGIVLHDAGKVVLGPNGLEFEAGRHQVRDEGEDASFCAALG